MALERVSIEVTNRCAKACEFCYNHSLPGGHTRWTAEELVAFASDCAANGVKFPDFCFREKKIIQPLQWMPSRTWGSDREWVDEEGRRRKSDGTILE